MMIENKVCRICSIELDDDNWHPSHKNNRQYICKECSTEKLRLYKEANRDKVNANQRLYRKNDPEKAKAVYTRCNRKNGHLPMSENKECAQYLGIHIVERLLRNMFNDVEVMPMNHTGYDFICNKGKKIDAKSSCLRKDGKWTFNIKHNTTADYFVCVAFDNREDLDPLHVWIIPGHVLNHLSGATIRPSTLDKWAEYEKPIDNVVACCDTMKELVELTDKEVAKAFPIQGE